LFGDNAYINTEFLATPYSGTKGGTRDAYNFHHSQLRINIEHTFGCFVQCWGILRMAMPLNVSLAKTTAMVMALAKIHDYCTDKVDLMLQSTVVDGFRNVNIGAVPMVHSAQANMALPEGLLHAGHHFDDIGGNSCRNCQTLSVQLPRDTMHDYVAAKGLLRPKPVARRH
jgi:DDE superfamily endonuclease